MRHALALAIALSGCTSSPLGGPDGGGLPNQDGSQPADLAGASCGAIAASVQSWLDAHTSCTVDADCQVVQTACGLDGACGAIANTSAPGPYLESLVTAWRQDQCGPFGCECPAIGFQPGCNHGVCGMKMPGSGAVGDPCVDGSDCQSGFCATGDGFVGGYCTYAGCANQGGIDPCPTGSKCWTLGASSYCLKDCATTTIMPDCRDGYACCGGPGPTGPNGWCAPVQSFLCLAQ